MKKITLLKVVKVIALGFMPALIISVTGCGPKTYMVPNYKEFTTGGIFADKYWNYFTEGKNLKLEGRFENVYTEVINNNEVMYFLMDVPNGLHPVKVYFTRAQAPEIYNISENTPITVYGSATLIKTISRINGGNTGSFLGLLLDKIELN